MDAGGKFYNLYHGTDNFLKLVKKFRFDVEKVNYGVDINFPQVIGSVGSVFSDQYLVLYDDFWKQSIGKTDKKLRKGLFNILKALAEDFEIE